jgi:hypothetical protein
MINNTFQIVAREKDYIPFSDLPGRDFWGWEVVDNAIIIDYTEAKKLRKEYEIAMPSHYVRIRATRIKEKTCWIV